MFPSISERNNNKATNNSTQKHNLFHIYFPPFSQTANWRDS